MKSVLVTGAGGFLGTALCLHLRRHYPDVRVVGLIRERNYKTQQSLLDTCSVVYGDVRDPDAVRYSLSQYEVDTIFHLAAVTVLGKAHIDPVTCFSVNVMGLLNVLAQAERMRGRVKKVVISVSDKCYGTYERLPYVETMPVQASADTYSTSKACQDLIAQYFPRVYDLDVSHIRAGNIYGPGDMNLSRLIPGTILRCLHGEAPVVYKGVGQYRREWLYVDDVVLAFLAVAERGNPGEAYNVGGSEPVTVLDTVEHIRRLTGCDLPVIIRETDFIEIKEQWLDASKLGRLGWRLSTTLDEGLSRAVEWYRWNQRFLSLEIAATKLRGDDGTEAGRARAEDPKIAEETPTKT